MAPVLVVHRTLVINLMMHNNAVDDGYWEDANFWNFGRFDGEVGDSGLGSSTRSVAW